VLEIVLILLLKNQKKERDKVGEIKTMEVLDQTRKEEQKLFQEEHQSL